MMGGPGVKTREDHGEKNEAIKWNSGGNIASSADADKGNPGSAASFQFSCIWSLVQAPG